MRYSPLAEGYGITIENTYLDMACHRPFDHEEPHPSWDEDKYEALHWYYTALLDAMPGLVTCSHGMSLQQCVDPVNHYPREDYY